MAPEAQTNAYVLPVLVVGPVDVGRLHRELEAIHNTLQSATLRGEPQLKLPKTSYLMDQLIELNKLDLVNETDRAKLGKFLTDVKANAPRLHMSFSADPSPQFVQKLMQWLRTEIHPSVLLTVGLQPSIGAGCVVRTTNKYFDLSLSKNFSKKTPLLMEKLRSLAI